MEKVVVGIVDTPKQAEVAVERMAAMGFPPHDISVLFPDRRGNHDFAFEHHTKAAEGALAGAVVGTLMGLSLGAITGLGLLAIPGLGVLVSVGPVLAALAVATVLSVAFGAVGAFVGLGVPEIEAKHYVGKVRIGTILVGVHANNRAEVARAREVLRSVAASNIAATGEAAIPVSQRA